MASLPIEKTAKKMAKMVSKDLPVEPVGKEVVKAVRQRRGNGKMGNREIEQTARVAMKQAVKGMVEEAAKPRKRE
jgi:hypothetical protein